MPRPKWCCQSRFTITRAVSGLSGDWRPSFASASRRPVLPVRESTRRGTACRPAKIAGEARLHLVRPGSPSSPRSSRYVFGGGPGGRSGPSPPAAAAGFFASNALSRFCSSSSLARSSAGMRLGDLGRGHHDLSLRLGDEFLLPAGPLLRRRAVRGLRPPAESFASFASNSSRPVRPFERGDLVADRLRQRLVFACWRPRGPSPSAGGGDGQVAAERGRGEERLQAVVVGLRDRLELVVVAAGAGDRQPEERERRPCRSCRSSVFCRRCAWSAESVMSGPSRLNPVATRAVGVAGERLVAGELLDDEAVVRLVGVERADDVVAVPPGVGPGLVELVAVGVGVAGQVEPVPAPALAVVRARRAAGRPPSPRRPATCRRRRRRSPPASAAGRSGRT